MVFIIPPKKRNEVYYDLDFPFLVALMAWGDHKIDLTGLPPLAGKTGLRWHCPNFPATWHEVSRRFHEAAKQDLWFDTTKIACDEWRRRHADIAKSAA
jgi:hypothetical protein